MDKREKVIKGLECCIDYGVENTQKCEDCPYNDMGDTCERMEPLYEDAIALLKAQEPRDAIVVPNGIDRSGGWWYQCTSCKMEIKPRDRYCRSCGQAVKWDG